MSTDLEREDLEQRLRDALHEDAERARLANPDGPPPRDLRPLVVEQDRRPSARKLVAVAAAIAVIAAAGVAVIEDGDREPSVATSVDPEDQAIADAAVLTPDDMPFGWEAAPPDVEEQWRVDRDDFDVAFAECLGIDVAEVQNDAPSAASAFVNTHEPNDELVTSRVTMFASSPEAWEVVDRLRDGPAQGCFLDVVEQQIAEGARDGITTLSGRELAGDDVTVGESTITEVYLEYYEAGFYKELGGDSLAFRAKVPLTSEGVDVDVYAVVVFVRKGRALVETSFQTYFSGFDGGPTSIGLAPRTAVLLTKAIVDRLPAATSPAPVDPVEQPVVEPVEEPRVLPEPGELPADPSAAEEQVRDAFTGLFDASVPREDRAQFVDRPEVWLPLNQALFESEYGEILHDLHAVVDAVVFTSPTHAAVQFQLIASDPRVPGDPVIGDALLSEGRWVVAVTTPCFTAEATGFECDFTP